MVSTREARGSAVSWRKAGKAIVRNSTVIGSEGLANAGREGRNRERERDGEGGSSEEDEVERRAGGTGTLRGWVKLLEGVEKADAIGSPRSTRTSLMCIF